MLKTEKDVGLIRSVVYALGRIGDARAVDMLLEMLKTEKNVGLKNEIIKV